MAEKLRLRFWLAVTDGLHMLNRASLKAYLWAVERASDATDWGEPSRKDREVPW